MALEELKPADVTLRLVPNEARFIPEGARFPNAIAIEASTDEKTDALQRSTPVRVSVWDRARTTVAEAVAFRPHGRPVRAYELPVQAVIDVGARYQAERLRVVRDFLEELQGKPGGDGHCGVEGLDRAPGQPRVEWRNLLDEIVRRCSEVHDPALKQ